MKIVRGTSQSVHGVPVPLGSPPLLNKARRRSSFRAFLTVDMGLESRSTECDWDLGLRCLTGVFIYSKVTRAI
eukprot:scaffold276428_cov31-Tisochrysis_lutea.AAC.2